MDLDQAADRPSKRVKLDTSQMDGTPKDDVMSTAIPDTNPITTTTKVSSTMLQVESSVSWTDADKEREVGIATFVDPSRSVFRGVLKKRYTDFLVNEILPDGTVLHLRSMRVKRAGRQERAGSSTLNEDGGEDVESRAVPAVDEGNFETRPAEGQPLQGANAALNVDRTQDSTASGTAAAEAAPAGVETNDAEAGNGNSKTVNGASTAQADQSAYQLSDDDRAKLSQHFHEETITELDNLYQSTHRHPTWKPREHPTVRSDFTSDRTLRYQIHQDIRSIFNGKIESSTDKDGVLVLTAAAPTRANAGRDTRDNRTSWNNNNSSNGRSSRPNKLSWQDRGGEYLHFSLYKENKDTLEVISYISKQLKTNTKVLQFAGTKDRRAVTVQRVSAYRVEAERLVGLNRSLRYAAIGDFEYQPRGLELGDLSGNEFVVTLRDCALEETSTARTSSERKEKLQTSLQCSLAKVHESGFLNYYGLQRFGTFATRTDVVGLKILQSDFKGACDAILSFSNLALNVSDSETGTGPGRLIAQDDRARAEGINIFQTTGRVNEALDKIPRKFGAETNIIRRLGRYKTDYVGALLGIQRNLRLMYVHAYQSLVWNLAVGERWSLYGGEVVGGDLVLVHEHADKVVEGENKNLEPTGDVDADGEVIITASGDDRAHTKDDMFERARALSASEAASGQYSIFDIVLPQPGFDVLYPSNAVGEWYKTFMGSEAGGRLDPHDMRRKQKDFSLSGSYRKVLARIGKDFHVEVHEYNDRDGDKQFVQTDMEKMKQQGGEGGNMHGETAGGGEKALTGDEQTKLAAVLKFQLSSSQYATMALRELSKGGVQAYKAEFMGGR